MLVNNNPPGDDSSEITMLPNGTFVAHAPPGTTVPPVHVTRYPNGDFVVAAHFGPVAKPTDNESSSNSTGELTDPSNESSTNATDNQTDPSNATATANEASYNWGHNYAYSRYHNCQVGPNDCSVLLATDAIYYCRDNQNSTACTDGYVNGWRDWYKSNLRPRCAVGSISRWCDLSEAATRYIEE